MNKTDKKSCSILKVALSILGFALLTAIAALGRRKIRSARAQREGGAL